MVFTVIIAIKPGLKDALQDTIQIDKIFFLRIFGADGQNIDFAIPCPPEIQASFACKDDLEHSFFAFAAK